MALLEWIIETSMKIFISNRVKVELLEMDLLINHKKFSTLKEHLQKIQAFFRCNNFLLGHLHLKVRSASIAAFRILLAISLWFVWILSKNFSFFNISRKSFSFITWNLIEYLHTEDFQRPTAHLNVWENILFSFVYGCKTKHKNILTQSKGRKLVFTLRSPPQFKPYLLT